MISYQLALVGKAFVAFGVRPTPLRVGGLGTVRRVLIVGERYSPSQCESTTMIIVVQHGVHARRQSTYYVRYDGTAVSLAVVEVR